MSLPRLVFLYPHLFKSAKAYECSLPHHPPRTGGKRSRKSTFSTSTQQRQESYAQRYGSAAEPQPPPLAATNGLGGKSTLANTIEKEVKAPALKPEERKPDTTEIKQASSAKQEAKNPPEKDYQPQPSNDFLRGGKLDSSKALAREPLDVAASNATGNSLETVLHTENPADKQSEEHKPPHLHAPPYVHHFDTFTLVRDLQKGGFTEGQSVNLMKAVRSLLAINLEVAREGLVSKSEMENVRITSPYFAFCACPHQYSMCYRKPISSVPPVPSSAPRSSIPAKPAPRKWLPSALTFNTKSTFFHKKPPRIA